MSRSEGGKMQDDPGDFCSARKLRCVQKTKFRGTSKVHKEPN